jgi:hypothetical protein
MSKKKKLTAEEVAEKIVAEMDAAGLSPYDMLRVLELAKVKYKRLEYLKGK